jgi:Fe-S cluster biosynthesis and repair protein YggX
MFIFLNKTELSAQYINIQEDPSISELMSKYMEWEKEQTRVNGWRIQIINTDDRRKMEKALSDFRFNYPDIKYTTWKQVSPYYKVIVGAFDSKLDALAVLQDIKSDFPSAIPIIDQIEETELLEQ